MARRRGKFEYHWWAFRSRGLAVIADDGHLLHGDALFSPSKEIAPSDADWSLFWQIVDALHVWEWEKQFLQRNVLDAYHWRLRIQREERSVESEGSNAAPEGFAALHAAVQGLIDGGVSKLALRKAVKVGRAFEPSNASVEELIGTLQVSRDRIEREHVLRALGRFGPQAIAAIPALLDAMKRDRPKLWTPVAEHALRAILDAATPAAIPNESIDAIFRAAWNLSPEPEVMFGLLAKLAPLRLAEFRQHPSSLAVRWAERACASM
ncbi:MAG TPA: hypothetical protein VKU19_35790 [Bryobacteraceae bacterium]|nr:hypothetical protein [Bryobacteraceae bacterium]